MGVGRKFIGLQLAIYAATLLSGQSPTPPAPSRLIQVRVLFEKPSLIINPKIPAHARLDFKEPLRIPAPCIRIQCWMETDGIYRMVHEEFTDTNGYVWFEGIPGIHYRLRAIPILELHVGAKLAVSAAIYRQEDPLHREGWKTSDSLTESEYPMEAVLANAWPEEEALGETPDIQVGTAAPAPVDWIIPVSDTKAGRKSGPFNILWMVYQSFQWVLEQHPEAGPFPMIHINWDPSSNMPKGTYFNEENSIAFARVNAAHAKDTDEFDDSVLGHELGHFIAWTYHSFISPGGDHPDPDGFAYDWTLTMSEGWATFFQAAVRTQEGAFSSSPDYYDTISPSTSEDEGLLLTQPAAQWRKQREVSGVFSEVSVARALWRLYQNPAVFDGNGGQVLETLRRLPETDLPIALNWTALVKTFPQVDPLCVDQISSDEGFPVASLNLEPRELRNGPATSPLKGTLQILPKDSEPGAIKGDGNLAGETAYFYLTPEESTSSEILLSLPTLQSSVNGILILEIFHHAQLVTELQMRLSEFAGGPMRLPFAPIVAQRYLIRVRLETHSHSPAPASRLRYQIHVTPVARSPHV